MYHIIGPNSLYDILNESKIELSLVKDKETFDISKFLDDVSSWIDNNREHITDKYLPFAALSVGIMPIQISAFIFGLFLGKALEKHGLTIKLITEKVDREIMLKEIEDDVNSQENPFTPKE
jgi:hypothetical protein